MSRHLDTDFLVLTLDESSLVRETLLSSKSLAGEVLGDALVSFWMMADLNFSRPWWARVRPATCTQTGRNQMRMTNIRNMVFWCES